MNEQLNTYVKENLAAGYTPDQLKTALIAQGWDPKDVEDALSAAKPAVAPATPAPVKAASPLPSSAHPPTDGKIGPTEPQQPSASAPEKRPLWHHALFIVAIVLVLCGIGAILYYFLMQ